MDRAILFPRASVPVLIRALVAGVLLSLVAVVDTLFAEDRKALLLLPVAGGTPGQEWSAKALGGILEDGLVSLRSIRLVGGTARERALRELSAGATITPEAFQEICSRAGADLAVLGGSTLSDGRLSLEVRVFDVETAREVPPFRGEEPLVRAFDLVEAAVRHVAAAASLGKVESPFPRGRTTSLEAYAEYRAAVLEESPAARVEKLRGVLKLDADYADPTARLGVELFRQGSLDEALGVLERAVALGPKVAETRNNYGVALAAAGRAEQAQREFEAAVALAPDYAEARLNLARVFEDRGRLSDAEKQYTRVLEADAGNDKARSGLALLFDRTGRPELAIKEFRLLSARRPEFAEEEFIRAGQEARKAREYARAEKYFLRATDINPQFGPAWAELGTNSYLAGEYARGVEYFRKALVLDPGQAAYHYYLALALDKGRQQEEALREYRRAVELGGPPEARLGLARAALESGDPGLAVEELNRLLAASPDNAEAKTLIAQATSEMEARRRLVEGQSQFANQRLARLEQIVADANRANRELEARLQSVMQEKQFLENKIAGRGSAPAGTGEPIRTEGASTEQETSRTTAAAAELGREIERLRAELAEERDARRREGAEALAGLALARADKDRLEREIAEERERFKREIERVQAELAAAQAKSLELGRGSGEVEELRQRLAGLQADQARRQTEFSQEREARLKEAAGLKADLTAEREARRIEAERFKTELAATEGLRGELAKKVNETAGLKGQLLAAQDAISRAEDAQKAERERGERALAAEREARRSEVEKLRAELASGQLNKLESDRLLQDLAAERSRTAVAQVAREKAESALAAGQESLGLQIDKLKTELAGARVARQDQDRLAQELVAERARTLAEQSARGKNEQAFATEREESRRQAAQSATRLAALEEQVKTLTGSLQARETDLVAARARENSIAVEYARARADLELRAERQAVLEARAAAGSRALAEREQALENARLAVLELALELSRIALRTQSWEKARAYLEQAADADPRSAEAWYGLGEVFFQLGQYEKSKQMYDKAKQIY